MCAEGISPQHRHLHLPIRAMESLGYRSFTITGPGAPTLLKRIQALHAELYRRKDIAVGGLHGGAFMFRGIAAHVHIPIIYGRVAIDPFALCDLSSRQINWLRSSEKDEQAYIVNICNLFDFTACVHPMGDYGTVPPPALPLLQLASLQTQSAAATLCAAFDERGCGAKFVDRGGIVAKGGLGWGWRQRWTSKGFRTRSGQASRGCGQKIRGLRIRCNHGANCRPTATCSKPILVRATRTFRDRVDCDVQPSNCRSCRPSAHRR